MTKAHKLEIKNQLLQMRENTKKQRLKFQQEIENKKQILSDLQEENSKNHELFSQLFGIASLLEIINKIKKRVARDELRESLNTNNELIKKEFLSDKLNEEIKERLDIIEKAENKDLKEFLEENDVYSIFEKGKLENYFNKENLSENQKFNEKNNENENKNESSQNSINDNKIKENKPKENKKVREVENDRER